MAKPTLADRLSFVQTPTRHASGPLAPTVGMSKRLVGRLKGQRGTLTLAEVMGAVIVGSIIIAQQFPIISETNNIQKDVVTGSQLGDYGLAATRFIGDNFAQTLAAVPTVGNVTLINASILRDGGTVGGQAVPGGYLPLAANLKNNFNQDYTLCVRRISATDVAAILLTQNGREIPFDRLASSAINAAWGGGFIRQDDPTKAQGIGGSWGPFDLAPCAGAGATVQGGRLAYLVAIGNGAAVQDWLSRRDVPGNPAATRMETSPNWNNNDILNIGQVQTEIARAYSVSEAVYDARIAPARTTIQKPSCKTGQSPQIFLAAASYSDNGTGSPIAGVRTYAVDMGANWQVNIEVDTALGTINVDSNYGRLFVVAKCTN
jgi:Bacterial shufflon protein, N-terminal constant region